jgi:hypothetical protein
MNTTSLLSSAGALVLLAALAPEAVPAKEASTAAQAALAGSWRLDAERRDDAREKLREAMEANRDGMRGPRGGMGGGRMGGRGGGPGGEPGSWPEGGPPRRGPRGGGERGERPEAVTGRGLLEASEVLIIELGEGKVTLRPGTGRERTLETGGKKHETETPGGKLETKAQWKDTRLIVESKHDRGIETEESYETSADGRTMTVSVKAQGRGLGRPVTLHRVYEQAEAAGVRPVPAEETPRSPGVP